MLNGVVVPPGQPLLAAATVQDAGTVFDVGNALVIGRSRDAVLEISNGGTVRSVFGVVGETAGIAGGVHLSGSGGASWSNSTSLVVGKAGRGSVEVGAASTLRSATASLGQDAGSYGLVVLNGAQASWINNGTLSFINDVSGSGSFAGSVRFLAGYRPGNSTGRVGFGAGSVGFGAQSTLSLEIDGTTPGSGCDQLLDIGSLSFDGTLALGFGSGFSADAGARLSLLDFDAFQGSLDAAHVRISGIDAGRVDLSRLGIDGSIGISGVPKPGTWALWLSGLGMAAVQLTRRRRTHP